MFLVVERLEIQPLHTQRIQYRKWVPEKKFRRRTPIHPYFAGNSPRRTASA
jgi:hypothetical protein